MAKGNRLITDNELFTKISIYQRPVALKELASALGWNPGKVDGSINRLQSQRKIATVKVAPQKGFSQRWAGIPSRKRSWQKFLQEVVVKQKFVLISDPLQIFNKSHSMESVEEKNYKTIKQTPNPNIEIRELQSKVVKQEHVIELLTSQNEELEALSKSLNDRIKHLEKQLEFS